MRKISFSVLGLVMSAALFTACDKEETASPLTIDMSKTATAKGYLFAELDLSTPGLEAAPVGTKVFGFINNSDILNNASDGLWSDTVEVTANGIYTFNFPIGLSTSTLTVTPIAFEANQTQGYGSYETSLPMVYSFPAGKTVVSTGAGADIPQMTMGATMVNSHVRMTQISGKVYAEVNYNNSSIDLLTGRELTFYSEGWSVKVVTNNKGEYTISVPYNKTISIASFEQSYATSPTASENAKYTAINTVKGSSIDATTGNDVTFSKTTIAN